MTVSVTSAAPAAGPTVGLTLAIRREGFAERPYIRATRMDEPDPQMDEPDPHMDEPDPQIDQPDPQMGEPDR